MSIGGGILDFFGKMGNRPSGTVNTTIRDVQAPDRGNYQAYNPYGAQQSTEQAGADKQAATQQLAQLQAKLSTIQDVPQFLEKPTVRYINVNGSMMPVAGPPERVPNPRFAEIQKMRQDLTQQIQATQQRITDSDRQVRGAQTAVAGEQAAKGYESRQVDPQAYQMMLEAAQGKSPSVAEMQLQRQAGALFNQNQSMVNSARSYNPALARSAMFQNASQQADLAGQGSMLRAQEMANARNAFAQYGLSQQGANDAMANQIRGLNAGYAGMNLQGGMGYSGDVMRQQQTNMQGDMWKRQMENDAINARNQANRDMWSSAANTWNQEEKQAKETVGTVIGSLGGLSDERAKQNIRPAGGLTDQFAAVTPVAYNYKPEFGGQERVGVVAQDLAKTPMGATMVAAKKMKGAGSMKKINGQAAVSTLLANAAESAQRIKALEGLLGGIQMRKTNLAAGAPLLNAPLTMNNVLEADHYNRTGRRPGIFESMRMASKARNMGDI